MGLLHTIAFIVRHPLNERRRLEALLRFCRWQVASRLAPGPVIVNFVDNVKLVLSPGRTGATMNFYTGLQEYDDMAFLLHTLRSEDLFVDVGANVGSYTLLAAGAVGARCVSLEPVPLAFGRLLENIRLN